MQFGRNIHNLRKLHNMTQREFANSLEVSCATISKWEKNKSIPTYDHINKICELYSVDANFLYDNSKKINNDAIDESMSYLVKKLETHELLALTKKIIEYCLAAEM